MAKVAGDLTGPRDISYSGPEVGFGEVEHPQVSGFRLISHIAVSGPPDESVCRFPAYPVYRRVASIAIQSVRMVTCPGCGAASSENVRFCSSCGRAIAMLDTPTLEADEAAVVPAPVPPSSRPPGSGGFSPGNVLVEIRRRYRQVARCTFISPQARRWLSSTSTCITSTASRCICGPTTFL